MDRIAPYVLYHTCMCKLYREAAVTVLRLHNPTTETPSIRAITDAAWPKVKSYLMLAYNSAVRIGKVAERIVPFPNFEKSLYVQPHCLTISALMLSELCDRVDFGVGRSMDVARLVEAEIRLLETLEKDWRFFSVFLPPMREGLNRQACDRCKKRKRKCDGTIKGCSKLLKIQSAQLPKVELGHGERNEVGISCGERILCDSAFVSAVDAVKLVSSDGQFTSQSRHGLSFLWPSEDEYCWIHPSLDPLIMFMDQIPFQGYLAEGSDSEGSHHPMNAYERHVIEHFCDTREVYPFEVFDRSNLLEQIERLPHMLRYAFYSFCAQTADPPAPTPILNKFYGNLKAVARWCVDNPSLQALQALIMLFASYLHLDTQKLLDIPGQALPELTDRDREIRDRCWSLCLILDSGGAETTGCPRFFKVPPTFYHSQYFSPPRPNRAAAVYYYAMLSEASLKVSTIVRTFKSLANHATFLDRFAEAKCCFEAWRKSLPAYWDLRWVDGWVKAGQTFGIADMDRISPYLLYHASISKLYREAAITALRLDSPTIEIHNVSKSAWPKVEPIMSMAYKSALLVAKVAERIIQFPKFENSMYPLAHLYFQVSALMLCEFCDSVFGVDRRMEVARLVEAEIRVLEEMKKSWKVVSIYLPPMREGLKRLSLPKTSHYLLETVVTLCEFSDIVRRRAGMTGKGIRMPYSLEDARLEKAPTTSAVRIAFVNKVVCDKCRMRKRKCNGKIKGCVKYPQEQAKLAQQRSRSLGDSTQSSSDGYSFPLLDTAAKPWEMDAMLMRDFDHVALVHSDMQLGLPQRHGMSFLWPSEEEACWVHPSLDPLILFMDNITHHDYFQVDLDSFVSNHKMNQEEKHIIQHYCSTRDPYPFEAFGRENLIDHLETLPQTIRNAFFIFCSLYSDPPAPEPIIQKFYSDSKTVARWCAENPGLRSLQALFLLDASATSKKVHSSYLYLDTPRLLQFPSTPTAGITKIDEEIRDRCWNLCLLTDSSSAEMGNAIRFFKTPLVTPTSHSRYFFPPQPNQASMAYYHCLLSEVLLYVKGSTTEFNAAEDFSAFLDIASDAEACLLSWRNSLPPSLDLEWADSWVKAGQTFRQTDMDRIALYLGYHACKCKLYRAKAITTCRLQSRDSSATIHNSTGVIWKRVEPILSTAFKSALRIAKVAEKVLQFKRFDRFIYPHACYCLMVSGLLLCEFSDRMVGVERRDDVVRMVEAEIAVLEGLEDVWRMVTIWVPLIRTGLKELKERVVSGDHVDGTEEM
ncbi:hypothetical protein HDU97_005687 [Phlyctochytrium planicorne]|nr:hypothetical protein HDU97_005687 [Phlyctochytrium planicorne]